MSGLFGILNTGVRGLSASQLALNITSQNISNANTEGYSRKRLNLTSEYRRDPQFGQMGFGVEVTNITRIRDFFIDQEINRQTQELSYYKEGNDTLTRLENIFGEPSDTSLSNVLGKFWDSWSDLANNPESVAARDVVKANSQVLVDAFHNLSKEIRDLRQSKNDDVQSTVTQVNGYLKEIYNLNKEIGSIEITGNAKANDARDQRDLVVKRLSELINVTTEDAGNGMISVLTNGNMLVSPTNYTTLETSTVTNTRPDGTTYSTVGVRFSSTKQVYVPQSGKLRGTMDSRDVLIPEYESKLDALANSLVEQVNQQHRQGYSMNGTTGIDFFKVNSHDEEVKAHTEIVTNFSFAYNSLAMPYTQDLGTPNIQPGSLVLTRSDTGAALVLGSDYSVNNVTGTITLNAAGANLLGGLLPPPNIVASYNYDVPQGPQTIQQTFASNIELSAAINQDVINISASGGMTTKAYADTLVIPATGVYQYIHHTPGADGIYGTVDDDPDGIPGSGDELRERSSIATGSVSLSSGGVSLKENTDYYIDYPTGRIILLNNAYAGAPLNIAYQAGVPGSNGFTDNANAVAIAELRHTKVMDKDYTGEFTSTLTTFYDSFISQLGVGRNEFTANTDSRQALVDQFTARQAEIAGVSLDEELANLVKYQHTYQASARVITTVDKMLDVLFNM